MSSVTLANVLTRLEQSHAQCALGQSCDRFADLQAMAPEAVEDLIISDLKGSLERAKQAMLILSRTCCPEKPMLKAFDVALRHADQDISLAAFLILSQFEPVPTPELREIIDAEGYNSRLGLARVNRLRPYGPAAAPAVGLVLKTLDIEWNFVEPYEDDYVDQSTHRQKQNYECWLDDVASVLKDIGPVGLTLAVTRGQVEATVVSAREITGKVHYSSDLPSYEAVPVLRMALLYGDAATRRAAARAIVKVDEIAARVLPELLLVADQADESPDIRVDAELAILSIARKEKIPSAVARLPLALTSQDKDVLERAFDALHDLMRMDTVRIPGVFGPLLDIAASTSSFNGKAMGLLSRYLPEEISVVIPKIIKAVMENEEYRNDAVIHMFGRFRERSQSAAPLLASKYTQPGPHSKYMMAGILMQLGETGTVCGALRSEETKLRRASANALRWLREEEAPVVYPTIISMLNDPDKEVQQSLYAALSQYGQTAVTTLFAEIRQSIKKGDKLLLGEMKEKLSDLFSWATDWQQFVDAMDDEIPEIRRTFAAMLLGNIEDCPDRLAIYRSGVCHRDSEIRRLAAEKMSYHGYSVPTGVIIKALEDNEPKAADVLHTKGYSYSAAIVPLSRLLGHHSPAVRSLAAMALMNLRPRFSELSRRMGVELVGFQKQLHVFRLVGMLLLEDGSESSYRALSKRIEKVFGESYNETTVRNYLRQTAELFEQYRILSGVRQSQALDHERESNGMGFFQSDQGSPFRFLPKGWECWGETMLYFALNEGRLADLPWLTSGKGH